jgi:hypothetical protein
VESEKVWFLLGYRGVELDSRVCWPVVRNVFVSTTEWSWIRKNLERGQEIRSGAWGE